MKPFILLAALLALSACNTPERVAARHDRQCQSYGYAPGTANYGQCRMILDVERERNRNSGGGPDLTAQGLQMMRTGRTNPSVTCIPLPGGGMRCQ